MGFLQGAMAFFERHAPETLDHLQREAAKISAEKLLNDERECYRRELMRLGYRPERLKAMVMAYRGQLLTEVKRAS